MEIVNLWVVGFSWAESLVFSFARVMWVEDWGDIEVVWCDVGGIGGVKYCLCV